jgi:hypothetical protein
MIKIPSCLVKFYQVFFRIFFSIEKLKNLNLKKPRPKFLISKSIKEIILAQSGRSKQRLACEYPK